MGRKQERCRKIRYVSRREAREAKRRMVGENVAGLRAYKCPERQCGGMWHLGHLPEVIRRGEMTRGQVYGES